MSEERKKLGGVAFVFGGLSFIPLVGVPFGLVAIVWGLATDRIGGKKLALVGGGGIVFTMALYSALFYFGFVQRGGIYDMLREKVAESEITSLVQTIEFYKVQNGVYPESLETLQESLPEGSTVVVFDPTDMRLGGRSRYFHYELIDSEHYYLLGVGPDGEPFTADDIVPKMEVGPQSGVGLVVRGQQVVQ